MIDTSIIEKYENGYSLSKLSKEIGINSYALKKELVKFGVKIRNRNEQNKFSPQNQRKYIINDNYFSTQSANMAYLLGMYSADGCVYKKDNSIKLCLCSIDREFLEKIKKELNSNYPIRDYTTKDGYNNSEFIFSSRQIKEDFAKYNIIPLKTYSFKFPTNIKKEYQLDFIRGYFDGDGCVSTAGKAIRWQLASHESDILVNTVKIFESYGIKPVNIQTRADGLKYIQYSTKATKEIFNLLYYPNCFCLNRKFNKYISIMK